MKREPGFLGCRSVAVRPVNRQVQLPSNHRCGDALRYSPGLGATFVPPELHVFLPPDSTFTAQPSLLNAASLEPADTHKQSATRPPTELQLAQLAAGYSASALAHPSDAPRSPPCPASGSCQLIMQETAVFVWGAGEDGQLGLGDYEDESWPRAVDALADVKVVSLVGGSRNSLAIDEAGRLYTWGWNQRATLGHPPDTKIENLPSKVVALAEVKIVQAAIGGWHCLAVDDQGRTYAWGGNEYGQCGEVDTFNGEKGEKVHQRRDIQVPRKCAPKLRVRQVAAGGTHSVVLTDEGHVWTWGQPWPPGDITKISTPSRVQNLEKVQTIAVGAFHNLALLECGEVWAWGNNEYGQLGTGDTQPRAQPVHVKGLEDVSIIVAIAAGGWHSMALTVDGQVYGWGRGEHGRLGFGDDKSSKMVPAKVPLLATETIIQVSCGGTHSVALTIDGRIYSFGRGDHGRLGYGSLATTGHPCEVSIHLQPRKRHGGVHYIRKRSYHESPKLDSTEEKAGNWCIRLVACGGRHTLVLAAWDPDTSEDSPEE